MRLRSELLLGLALLLAGCGDTLEDTLPGRYVFDREAHAEQAFVRLVSEEATGLDELGSVAKRREREASLQEAAAAEGRNTHLRLVLAEGGTFKLQFRYDKEEGSAAGHWRVEDGRVRLETSVSNGRPRKPPDVSWGEPHDSGFLLSGDGTRVPIPFRRASAAK